jgi:hypothetical protein
MGVLKELLDMLDPHGADCRFAKGAVSGAATECELHGDSEPLRKMQSLALYFSVAAGLSEAEIKAAQEKGKNTALQIRQNAR